MPQTLPQKVDSSKFRSLKLPIFKRPLFRQSNFFEIMFAALYFRSNDLSCDMAHSLCFFLDFPPSPCNFFRLPVNWSDFRLLS